MHWRSSNRGYYVLLKGIICISLSIFICSSSVFAFDPTANPFSSSLTPVGSGARATGMGGAFIGLADDATAASWNPAGLVQLEKPEVSAVYSYFSRSTSYSGGSSTNGVSDTGSYSNSANGLNYASVAWPFVALGRNWTVSLNYQRLYEMTIKTNFNYTFNLNDPPFNDKITYPYNYNQTGYLYALSPAFSVQVIPQLYLGVTLNFWGDFLGNNGWKVSSSAMGSGTLGGTPITDVNTSTDKTKFQGFNANLGLMWKVNKFTVGAVYKFPFTGNLKSVTTNQDVQSTGGVPYSQSSSSATDYLAMKMPASYGLGVAYRLSDNWIFDCDVYHTDWSSSYIKDLSNGFKYNTLTGGALSDGRLNDTTSVHLGGEYLFIMEKSVIPVRAGFFYDPEPGTGSLDNYYGFSLGTGYSTQKVSFDLSYQYRFGNNLTGGSTYIPGSANVSQSTVMVSAIYYF